jgi:hypothetical protein
MTQVAALLRPRTREAEITKTQKSKTAHVSLVDWYKIGRDNPASVTFYNQGITKDTIKVKVSLA